MTEKQDFKMKKPFLIPPVALGTILTIQLVSGYLHHQLFIYKIQFITILGLCIFIIGYIIMIMSSSKFRANKTTLQWKETEHFVKDGLYKHSRNPQYLGMFIISIGFGLSMNNVISILLPLLLYIYFNYFVIPYEEQLLKNKFGNEFVKYKNNTKRWI